MRFTSIRLKGITTVDFPVVNTSSFDPYILKSAEGLGPPEINVFIAQSSGMDGYYKGRETQYREIVLSVSLNPNYKENITVSDLRSELYSLLSSGVSDSIDFVIVNEDGIEFMYTTGYIKKMEVVPFSATPEVQITIACAKSYFEASDGIHASLNPTQTQQEIINEGTAETGFVLTVSCQYTTPQFDLFDYRGKKTVIQFDFKQDDILIIDSRAGSRSITLERDDVFENIIYAMSMDSDWLTLYNGYNRIYSYSDFLWDDLYYIPRYWGI